MKHAKHIWLVTCLIAACGSGKETLTSAGDGDDTQEESSGSTGGSRGPTTGGLKDGKCESHTVASRKTTPDMLIVLDRSASMSPQGNPNRTDRWRGSVDAVLQVTAEFSKQINFGLMTFPAYEPAMMPAGGGSIGDLINGVLGGLDPAQACKAGTVNVAVGKDTADEIMGVLSTMPTGGLTPTASSLDAALMAVGSGRHVGDGVVPPKYVLLLTDGDPNCSQTGGGGGPGVGVDPQARQETIAAIEKLRDDGVQTFVVGYQTEASNFAQQLDMMAAAGGTGDTTHRSVSTAADLTETFNEIAGRALSCSFKLDAPVDDPTYVRVTVNGEMPRFENAGDGWTLGQDKQTVTLTGAACDTVQAGAVFKVEVDCEQVFVQ